MIELDGNDGGGQLVRTALTLSAVGGDPFRMERVRGSRPTPGLKPQHLACVEAVASLTDADVEGAAVGSETLRFDPTANPDAAATPDEVAVDVGTAGSVTLVADTLLPLATWLDAPIGAALTGGTDVRWSPSADYLRRVKLPLLRAFGLDAGAHIDQRGFYPAGGGELDLRLRPSSLDPIDLGGRGGCLDRTDGSLAPDTAVSVHVAAAADLDTEDAADAVRSAATTALDDRGIAGDAAATTVSVDADSPGLALTVAFGAPAAGGTGDPETPTAGFVAYGGADDAPSSLATTAVDAAERWLSTAAPVDPHLADQLVVWLALAGGTVPIPRVTDHVRTNVDLVSAFGYDVSIEQHADATPAVVSSVKQRPD